VVAARVAGPLTTDNQLMTLFNTASAGAMLPPEVVATQRLRYFLIFFLFFYSGSIAK